jgi:hypothetical protein
MTTMNGRVPAAISASIAGAIFSHSVKSVYVPPMPCSR